jgi:hypothetical protein
MASSILVFGLVSLFAFDALAAWPNNTLQSLAISAAPFDQQRPAVVNDGNGGAFIAWDDLHAADFDYDVYVQHALRSGQFDPAWPAKGIRVGSLAPARAQYAAWLVPDGKSGAIVVWHEDLSGTAAAVYAQHLTAGGVDPTWPTDGVLLSATTPPVRFVSDMVPDGLGGAFVTWREQNTFYKSQMQHVTANATIAAGWPSAGVLLCSAANDQHMAVVAPDGSGGAIAAWIDGRVGRDVYAARVLPSGTLDPAWPVNGRAVCTGNYVPVVRIVTDGSGGALIVWQDERSASGDDVYAQHISGNGILDPNWASNGTAVCAATGFQYSPAVVSDGAGGALVAWEDPRSGASDIYAHHVTPIGVDLAWPVNGRAVCTAAGGQYASMMVSDGIGGMIVGWSDQRSSPNDLYAARVTSTGTIDPSYPINGSPVRTSPSTISFTPAIAGDGAGNAILVWGDNRNGTRDIFAQRLARHGRLGMPEAEIVSVKDVVNDQGGRVKVSWNASPLDLASDPNVVAYDLFRSVPTSLARRRLASGTALASISGPLTAGQLVSLPGKTDTEYWEFVSTTTPVHFLAGYSEVAVTEQDSVASGNPSTPFMVVARNAGYTLFWPSNTGSGYSVDNLAPTAPTALIGTYAAGATTVQWNANPETDLAGYRLYRGANASFVPGSENLIATPTALIYVDAGAPGSYYRLSAVDVHGNEGPTTLLEPSQTVDVPTVGALPVRVALLPARPSPSRGSVNLEIQLPRSMRATLAIHDVSGRRVKVLVEGVQPAGVHRVTWDPGARTVAGLYFATLDTEDGRRTSRIVLAP